METNKDQLISKTQIFGKGDKNNLLSSFKIRQIQERATQSRPRPSKQSQKQDSNPKQVRKSGLKEILMEQNNKEIIKQIQSLTKQLLINLDLKNKKNINSEEQQVLSAFQQWQQTTKSIYRQNNKNLEKSVKINHQLNFNHFSKAQKCPQIYIQPSELEKSLSQDQKTQKKGESNRQTKHFNYKVKDVYIDMHDEMPITLSYSFQTLGDCNLTKIKALLSLSIHQRFTQYNKPYFIKQLKLNPEVISEQTNRYSLSGTLEIRLLQLQQGHYHVPQKFQTFQVEELKIWNEFGSITWKDVDLRKIDGGRNIKIEDNAIFCANQSLNRQCVVLFNTIPLDLQQLRRYPQLFQSNLIQLLSHLGNCELLSYDLSKCSWKMLIKSFPE